MARLERSAVLQGGVCRAEARLYAAREVELVIAPKCFGLNGLTDWSELYRGLSRGDAIRRRIISLGSFGVQNGFVMGSLAS